jgi:hypothetical protein
MRIRPRQLPVKTVTEVSTTCPRVIVDLDGQLVLGTGYRTIFAEGSAAWLQSLPVDGLRGMGSAPNLARPPLRHGGLRYQNAGPASRPG